MEDIIALILLSLCVIANIIALYWLYKVDDRLIDVEARLTKYQTRENLEKWGKY